MIYKTFIIQYYQSSENHIRLTFLLGGKNYLITISIEELYNDYGVVKAPNYKGLNQLFTHTYLFYEIYGKYKFYGISE